VGALTGGELDEQAASAVALLALVAGQDVEPAEGSDGMDGRWRIARKVAEELGCAMAVSSGHGWSMRPRAPFRKGILTRRNVTPRPGITGTRCAVVIGEGF
jgi:hypothetical protein